jgi:hypothetical protein
LEPHKTFFSSLLEGLSKPAAETTDSVHSSNLTGGGRGKSERMASQAFDLGSDGGRLSITLLVTLAALERAGNPVYIFAN